MENNNNQIEKMFEIKQKNIKERSQEKDVGMMVGNAITNAITYIVNNQNTLSLSELYDVAKKIIDVSLKLKEEYSQSNNNETEEKAL